MKKDERFSEEQINAFVDGELDPEEKSQIYSEAEQSEELDRRLCQQRKLKELVQHAYAEVPSPKGNLRRPLARSEFLGGILVAGILLVVGIAGGLVAHSYLDANAPAVAAITEPGNYILHVASGEPEDMRLALEQARYLLDSGTPGHQHQVEVVANERGLNLLRSDVTPFAAEIRALQDSHVVFYACSRTIERLQEKGVEVTLLPEARTDYTALDRVVMRMKDGWEYIKI